MHFTMSNVLFHLFHIQKGNLRTFDVNYDFLTYIFNVSENTVIIHLDYGDMAV